MMTVAAGILERDGRILACRRRADQSHPLKWEFPGGKADPGEDPRDALARELDEELGIQVCRAREITRYEYQYPGRPPILLVFYRVWSWGGSVQNCIFEEIRWATPAELAELDFLEGDADFLRQWVDVTLSEP